MSMESSAVPQSPAQLQSNTSVPPLSNGRIDETGQPLEASPPVGVPDTSLKETNESKESDPSAFKPTDAQIEEILQSAARWAIDHDDVSFLECLLQLRCNDRFEDYKEKLAAAKIMQENFAQKKGKAELVLRELLCFQYELRVLSNLEEFPAEELIQPGIVYVKKSEEGQGLTYSVRSNNGNVVKADFKEEELPDMGLKINDLYPPPFVPASADEEKGEEVERQALLAKKQAAKTLAVQEAKIADLQRMGVYLEDASERLETLETPLQRILEITAQRGHTHDSVAEDNHTYSAEQMSTLGDTLRQQWIAHVNGYAENAHNSLVADETKSTYRRTYNFLRPAQPGEKPHKTYLNIEECCAYLKEYKPWMFQDISLVELDTRIQKDILTLNTPNKIAASIKAHRAEIADLDRDGVALKNRMDPTTVDYGEFGIRYRELYATELADKTQKINAWLATNNAEGLAQLGVGGDEGAAGELWTKEHILHALSTSNISPFTVQPSANPEVSLFEYAQIKKSEGVLKYLKDRQARSNFVDYYRDSAYEERDNGNIAPYLFYLAKAYLTSGERIDQINYETLYQQSTLEEKQELFEKLLRTNSDKGHLISLLRGHGFNRPKDLPELSDEDKPLMTYLLGHNLEELFIHPPSSNTSIHPADQRMLCLILREPRIPLNQKEALIDRYKEPSQADSSAEEQQSQRLHWLRKLVVGEKSDEAEAPFFLYQHALLLEELQRHIPNLDKRFSISLEKALAAHDGMETCRIQEEYIDQVLAVPTSLCLPVKNVVQQGSGTFLDVPREKQPPTYQFTSADGQIKSARLRKTKQNRDCFFDAVDRPELTRESLVDRLLTSVDEGEGWVSEGFSSEIFQFLSLGYSGQVSPDPAENKACQILLNPYVRSFFDDWEAAEETLRQQIVAARSSLGEAETHTKKQHELLDLLKTANADPAQISSLDKAIKKAQCEEDAIHIFCRQKKVFKDYVNTYLKDARGYIPFSRLLDGEKQRPTVIDVIGRLFKIDIQVYFPTTHESFDLTQLNDSPFSADTISIFHDGYNHFQGLSFSDVVEKSMRSTSMPDAADSAAAPSSSSAAAMPAPVADSKDEDNTLVDRQSSNLFASSMLDAVDGAAAPSSSPAAAMPGAASGSKGENNALVDRQLFAIALYFACLRYVYLNLTEGPQLDISPDISLEKRRIAYFFGRLESAERDNVLQWLKRPIFFEKGKHAVKCLDNSILKETLDTLQWRGKEEKKEEDEKDQPIYALGGIDYIHVVRQAFQDFEAYYSRLDPRAHKYEKIWQELADLEAAGLDPTSALKEEKERLTGEEGLRDTLPKGMAKIEELEALYKLRKKFKEASAELPSPELDRRRHQILHDATSEGEALYRKVKKDIYESRLRSDTTVDSVETLLDCFASEVSNSAEIKLFASLDLIRGGGITQTRDFPREKSAFTQALLNDFHNTFRRTIQKLIEKSTEENTRLLEAIRSAGLALNLVGDDFFKKGVLNLQRALTLTRVAGSASADEPLSAKEIGWEYSRKLTDYYEEQIALLRPEYHKIFADFLAKMLLIWGLLEEVEKEKAKAKEKEEGKEKEESSTFENLLIWLDTGRINRGYVSVNYAENVLLATQRKKVPCLSFLRLSGLRCQRATDKKEMRYAMATQEYPNSYAHLLGCRKATSDQVKKFQKEQLQLRARYPWYGKQHLRVNQTDWFTPETVDAYRNTVCAYEAIDAAKEFVPTPTALQKKQAEDKKMADLEARVRKENEQMTKAEVKRLRQELRQEFMGTQQQSPSAGIPAANISVAPAQPPVVEQPTPPRPRLPSVSNVSSAFMPSPPNSPRRVRPASDAVEAVVPEDDDHLALIQSTHATLQ